MEEEAKKAFKELRESVARLLERTVTYTATDSLEGYVKTVTNSLCVVSSLIRQVEQPVAQDVVLREEVEKLRAELEVQKQLLALCGLEASNPA